MKLPPKVRLSWRKHYRLIPSRHPYIDVFDAHGLTDEEKAAIWDLQKRTHKRHGGTGLARIRPADIATGHGAYYLNGPFIHTGRASRFTDGSYGVYYAAHELNTAIIETKYGYERVWRSSHLVPESFTFRALKGNTVHEKLYDIRNSIYYKRYLNPDISTYPRAQSFAAELRKKDLDAYGIVYPSVRDADGECIAVFRGSAIPIPVQACLLTFDWNGSEVTTVSESTKIMEF
jgi:hypothetical protein